MPIYRLKRSLRAGMSLLTILSFLSSTLTAAYANPLDGQVVGGQATISGQGTANVTINQSTSRAAIDWRSFSIDHGEQTRFIQPDSHSLTLNRVTGADPSRILGSMSANGTIILVNPNGVVFGQGSKVDAAGLVATTHDIDKNAFMAGGPLRFNQNTQAQPGAGIVNEGTITIRDAGVAALVAPQVRNSGLIVADGGVVNLAAGQGFALDLYGDKLVSFGVNDEIQDTITDAHGVPVKALVDNDGTIQASGGKILLTANAARQVVNQAINVTGTLAASHATRQGGKIILSSRNGAGVASGVVNIGNAKIDAKGTSGGTVHVLGDVVNVSKSSIDVSGRDGGGVIRVGGGKQGGENLATATTTTIDRDTTLKADATQNGKGGNIVVWADDTTDYQGSLSAKGGAQSGDGGFAEVSGKKLLKFKGQVDLTAAHGKTGDLLLDPQNLTIQNSAGSPAANCVGSTCTPGGDSSILTVADLENLLLTSNVTVSTGASGAQAGNITVADNITWTTGNRLMLDAHGSIIINGLVTIKNTYTGTFGANDIPVLLSLRADATGANNGGSFTNNGTIDFSGSNGAVSIFYDRATYGGSYTAGTQSQKTGWTAPTNLSVSNQFTAYQLINNVTDLEAISGNLAGNYALGKNIDGGGLAFNSNVPLGTFTGKLDGQYCALSGGANCSITNLTLTAAAASTAAGLFNTISATGIVRNLTLGLSVTQNYTGSTTNYVGALAGTNSGTIANVTSTGSVNYTFTNTNAVTSSIGGLAGLNTGTIRNASTTTGTVTATSANGVSANISTFYVGGLVGQQQTGGTITNSTSSQNVSYVYKGQSTGASVATVGGLVGYNISTTANSVAYSSASGAVNADYFSGYNGNVSGYLGGLIGQNGNNTATSISNVSATGAVGNTLHTATTGTNYQIMGGLIGWHNSNLSTSGAPSISTAFATGNVTYNGTTMNAGSIGGLIGSINNSGWVDNVYATGAVSYTGNTKSNVAGLIGWTNGSVSNAYATGAVSATYNSIAASTTDMNVAGLIGQITGNLSNSHATGNVSAVYNSGTASSTWVGGLVGQMAGNITNSYTETGAVTLTSQVSGTSIIHTAYVGGLVGQQTSGAISGSTSTQNVSYVYKGTSTGASIAMVGGLVGYNLSTTANSISASSADGDVSAEYFTGFTGNVNGNIGGLVGKNGNGSATAISNVSATGDVRSTLGSLTTGNNFQFIGGLVGHNVSSLSTSASPAVSNAFATGNVTYDGSSSSAINVAGLIGQSEVGWIDNVYATGNVSYTGMGAGGIGVAGLIGNHGGGLSNAYTEDGEVKATNIATGSTISAIHMGGLVAYVSGGSVLSNVKSTENVSYVYKSNSTGTATLNMGGLIGTRNVAGALSSTSFATGNVLAENFTGFNGNVTVNAGGLIGQNGNANAAVTTGAYATGNVTDTLNGSAHNVGGLIGYNNTTGDTSGSTASGDVSYNGTGNGAVGGFVGYDGNASGSITSSTSSGSVANTSGPTAAASSYLGGFAGLITGTLTGSYSTNTDDVIATSTATGSGVHTFYVGGQVGYLSKGTIANVASSANVSYVYKGTSTGVSVAAVGGLVGLNASITANSISGSSASGTVSADYFSGYNGDINGYIGGLVGWINGAVSISNVSATGNVSNKLHTLATGGNYEFTGGLIGRSNSSLNTAGSVAISNAFATGNVTYDGTTSASTHTGGLIGYNENGWLDNVHATGSVSYTGSSVVADTGGLIGSHVGAGLTNAYTQTGEVKATNITSGSVVSAMYVGGLIGYTPATTLTNVSSTQNVSYVHKSNSTGATTLYVAGLIGYKIGTGAITGTSFATGNVLAENFTGYSTSVTAYIGGLIGQNGNATGAITITGASASGNVTDTLNGSNHYLGGLIGYNASSGTISDSTASGDISYNGTGNGAVGGFVGYDFVAAGSITNSTSSGSVANTSGPTTSSSSYLGGFAGLMTGTLTGSYSTNTDDVIATSTATGSGVHTFYVGGQVGYLSKGTIANVNSSTKVSYVYKGTSSGIHILAMGGLVGLNASTTANSISASSSSGNVSADYFAGYDGTITTYIGGLIGQNGNGTATSITNVSATGDISNKLRTVASGASYQLTGGLIGWNYSTLTTSASPSVSYAFATGKVTYEGTTTASGASTNVAGLIAYNQTGWLDHVYATGNVSYIGSSPYVNVGGLTSSSYSGISNAYAKGNIDVTYTGSVASTLRVGGLVGYMEGAVSDSYTQDGKITVTSQVTGTNIVSTANVGGLVAVLGAGKISNSTSSQDVSYVYKGTSTGTSVANVGGLLGYNLSTTANSVSASSVSGDVSAEYFTGYTGNVSGYIGGAIGSNGNTGNIALSIDNVSASGDVISKLQGGVEYVGGLIGYHYSNLTTSTSPSINNAHATGKVTYSNTVATAANVGGLIGYNQGGWINNADATGETSYTGLGSANVGGLIGQNAGGLSNAWATGAASYAGPATSSVGGLIGSNTGVISMAYAKGNVSNIYTGSTAVTSYTGGLIGQSTNNVTDSYAEDGTVTATSQVSGTNIVHTSYVAGLIGHSSGATLTNLRSTENVSYVYKGTSTGASVAYIGGLIGYNSGIGTLSGTSSASGNVKAENFTGYNGVVTTYIGGLIGQNGNSNAATITGATASGNVTDTLNGSIHYAGGLIGHNNSTGTVSGSSASGDVSYDGIGSGAVGGFLGYDTNASGTISNNTSSGSVANTSSVSVAGSSYLGGFAGYINGILSGSSSTNTDDIIATSTATAGVHTYYVGGQVGYLARGSITNAVTSANVSFVYKGTSSSTSVAYVGGLVGYNISTTANSIANSSATGDVTAGYFSGFTGNVTGYIGGAIGQNGNATATSISGVSATGDVRSTLAGGTENVGGLIGWNYSTLTTSASPAVSGTSFATGDVSYIGVSSAAVGGLIGYNQTGWIDHVYATGAVSYNGGGTGSVGGLIGSTVGSISNAYAKGNVENIYTGNTAVTTNTGGLVGVLGAGTIADSYAEDGTVTVTAIVSGTGILHTANVGGLVGQQAGAISNSTSSQNVSFVYKGTTTGLATVSVGGLVGYNITPGANITGSSASGDVNAGYFTGYTGDATGYIGGLIGRYGNNNAISVSGSSASGDVRSTLAGGTEYVGGLIGWSNSNLSTSVSPGLSNVFATGDVSYEGAAAAQIGGLVGNNPYAWIDNAYATGKVSYTGSGNAIVGGLIGSMSAGVSNSYATGDIETLYLGAAAYTLNIGGLIGSMSGVLSDSYAEDGAITVTIQNSGTLGGAAYVGGLAGQLLNNATNVRSAQNVSYVYKGTSNGLSSAYLGGLVGLITSTNTSITNGSASGDVIANYATGYTGNVSSYMGGLIGQYGQNTAVAISNASATGDVRSTLTGGTEYIGGLIGWLYSTRTTSGAPALSNVSATGHVFYDGASNANVGGLVGYNQGSWIDKSYATGNVGYKGAGIASLGGLIGNSTGSISNAYAMGVVDYQGASTSSTVGGLVGTLTNGAVQRSFATGYVKNGDGVGGGLVASKNVSATITDSYWDQDTTGQSASVGGTGLTTTQLQATLQSNFSSSDWAILAGISYPYLKWQLPSGTAQIVSGYTYSDTDETLLKGAEVGLAVDGVDRDSALTNGHVYSGANGYYYYFLAPNTIASGGSDLLAYLPGTVKANTIHTGVTGSVDDLDLYGGWLNIISNKATLSGIMSSLAGIADGSNSNDILFTLSGNDLTLASGTHWGLYLNHNSTDLDMDLIMASGSMLLVDSDHDVTQSAAITADELVLTGTGDFALTNTDNAIGTLAANVGTLELNNGSADLVIGSLWGIDGVTADDVYLTTTGHVTQDEAIIADHLLLSGADSIYDLDHVDNAIGTLAANAGTINLHNGSHDLVIGSVNNVDGVTADDLYLTTTDEVTQTEAIIADHVSLVGTGSLYDLDHTDNAIGRLAAHVGTLNLNNGSADLVIDAVNNIDGITADDVYLATTGEVTQTEAIIADNLLLTGVGSIYDLDHSDNAIGTLAANAGTINLHNGSHDLVVGSVNNIDGVTVDDLYLTTTGHVTQTEAIIADHSVLSGANSIYDLDHSDNAIGTLAAHVGTLNLNNGSTDLVIGAVNNIEGITADNLYLATTGHVTQAEAITVDHVSLAGTGSLYDLTHTDNAIGTIAAHAGRVDLDNGGHDIVVGSVDNIDGMTTTDKTRIAHAGHIILDEAISASGTGDTLVLSGTKFTNNHVGANALDAGTGRFLVWSGDPANDAIGDLIGYTQYNATYGVTAPTDPGNSFLYSYNPVGSDPVKIVLATAAGTTQLHQMTSLLSAMPIAANVPTVQSDVMVDADVDVSCNPQTVTSSAQAIAISCGGTP